MSKVVSQAEYYRTHAEGLRAIVELVKTPGAKEPLRQAADEFERMAAEIERPAPRERAQGR